MRKHGKRVKVTVANAQANGLQAAVERAERNYLLNQQPVTNLFKIIAFELDGLQITRRLVPMVRQVGQEISIASSVGFRLANATPGQEFTIARPDGESSVVKVLAVTETPVT